MPNDIEIENFTPDHHQNPQHPCPPQTPCKQEFILSDGAKVMVNKCQEVNHDFTLHANPFKDFGTISGFVRDCAGHPIANALVKVFDHKHRPFAHVFTNREGQFLISVPPGHYILKAVR
ncbi:MAG TPA: carboxypeptidase-like regulatory domain-containing protein [Candidatus Deferrimicrobium sp.]|nr:carboxypeptidase-like regulatory domain-containing protein [Candidatus Deferrimicrobium sp.]